MKSVRIASFVRLLAILAALLIAAPAKVHAVAAVSVAGVNPDNLNFGDYTLGFRFTPVEDMNVTSLGFWEDQVDSVFTSHTVAIWALEGTLLASQIVDNTDALNAGFRFRAIAPLPLAAGTHYVIGATTTGGDLFTYDLPGDSAITFSGISYVENRYEGGVPLMFPGAVDTNTERGFIGPNFEFQASAIPEPGTLALLAFGLGLLGFVARRRRAL